MPRLGVSYHRSHLRVSRIILLDFLLFDVPHGPSRVNFESNDRHMAIPRPRMKVDRPTHPLDELRMIMGPRNQRPVRRERKYSAILPQTSVAEHDLHRSKRKQLGELLFRPKLRGRQIQTRSNGRSILGSFLRRMMNEIICSR